jgi:DnaJ-class molecular chaperone
MSLKQETCHNCAGTGTERVHSLFGDVKLHLKCDKCKGKGTVAVVVDELETQDTIYLEDWE